MGQFIKVKNQNKIIHVIEKDQYETSLKRSFSYFLREIFDSVEIEHCFDSGRRIDFLCKKGNRLIGIEYKTEKNTESKEKISSQLKNYDKDLLIEFGKKVEVYLLSPQGSITNSISEQAFLALFT